MTSTAPGSDLLFDPGSSEFIQDPYPWYRRIREAARVHPNPAGGWLLTRYHDCKAALQDPRLRKVENLGCYTDKHVDKASGGSEADVRMRDTTKAGLSPGAVRRIQQRIQHYIDALLDDLLETGAADLATSFCEPVAAMVFCEIFGVPVADRAVFATWGEAVIEGLDFVVNESPDATQRRNHAIGEFSAYLGELIAERRWQPGDDLLSAMVSVDPDGKYLSEEEMLFHCAYLLPAGQAPTAAFLGNAVHAMLRHPAELDRFRRLDDTEAGMRAAIEELVRYDPPAHIAVRAASSDLDLFGQEVKQGEHVIVLMGAANRDPEVFEDPDRLDLTRDPNPHIAFGAGAHYCLGAPLGRSEGQLALRSLVRRAPKLALAGTPVYKPTFARRALASLPVRLG